MYLDASVRAEELAPSGKGLLRKCETLSSISRDRERDRKWVVWRGGRKEGRQAGRKKGGKVGRQKGRKKIRQMLTHTCNPSREVETGRSLGLSGQTAKPTWQVADQLETLCEKEG